MIFWIGLIIGALIGGTIGFFACALLVITKQSDTFDRITNEYSQDQKKS